MKKLISLLLAALLALGCTGAVAENMIVHIHALCYDLNHIGTKWQAAYSIGGLEVYDGMVLDMEAATYDFHTEIGEYDTTPDIGTADSSFNVTASRLSKGFTVEQYLTVTENKGVYKDYWCEWYITYEFTPVGAAYVLN